MADDNELERMHLALSEDQTARRRGEPTMTPEEHFTMWDRMWEMWMEKKQAGSVDRANPCIC